MALLFDEDVLCPVCGSVLERLASGLWHCVACPATWTASEITDHDNELSRTIPEAGYNDFNGESEGDSI